MSPNSVSLDFTFPSKTSLATSLVLRLDPVLQKRWTCQRSWIVKELLAAVSWVETSMLEADQQQSW
jgi:hypothetical protein